jgi:serine/threonine protein kinase
MSDLPNGKGLLNTFVTLRQGHAHADCVVHWRHGQQGVVQVMHAAGLVHRDLKPGNILRMPDLHSWALIDFGCAAATGSCAGPARLVNLCLLVSSQLPAAGAVSAWLRAALNDPPVTSLLRVPHRRAHSPRIANAS